MCTRGTASALYNIENRLLNQARLASNSAETTTARLAGVPFSAKPSDIRSAISRLPALKGVNHVALEYYSFVPTGFALVHFQSPALVNHGVRVLDGMSIGGLPVEACPALPELARLDKPSRNRGREGREANANRIVSPGLKGMGAEAGIVNRSLTVVLGGIHKSVARKYLPIWGDKYRVKTLKNGELEAYRLTVPPGEFEALSRYLLYFKKYSEAHRIVRELHMTTVRDLDGAPYTVTAHIVH